MRLGSGRGGDAATGTDEFDAHSDVIADSASAFHRMAPDRACPDRTGAGASDGTSTASSSALHRRAPKAAYRWIGDIGVNRVRAGQTLRESRVALDGVRAGDATRPGSPGPRACAHRAL